METFLSSFSAFFPWLIDYTIDVSIFICLIFVIKSLISKHLPAWWHYGLWVVLLVRMLIPWRYERTAQLPELIPLPLPNIRILDSMIMGKNTMVSGIAKGASANIGGSGISFDEALLYTWLTGAFLLGLYTLFRNMSFWIRIKKISMITDREILDLLEECKAGMKINTIVGIAITDLVKSPALFGYLRPRLLLPEGVLEKLTKSELRYVFMHELGHLKRHDNGMSWIITLLQVFHWFNPFVWLAFYQMRIDQESACDASVLSRIKNNQSKDYAESIVGFLEKFCQNSQLPAMAGIIENKSQMKRRIAMIVKYKKNSKRITAAAIIMLLAMGFVFYTITGFAQESRVNSNETELSSDAQETLAEAQEFIQAQDFASARRNLQEYIDENPDHLPAEIYLMLGYSWYADTSLGSGKALDNALLVFEEGYEAYPDNFDLLSYYASVLYQTKYYTEAAPMMEKAYELDGKKKVRFLEAAWGAYYQVKNYEDTIRVLKKLISISDKPEKVWFQVLFNIYLNDIQDKDNAEKFLNTALEKFPRDETFLNLQTSFNGEGEFVSVFDSEPANVNNDNSVSQDSKNSVPSPIDEPPRVIRSVFPSYPAEAIQKGLEGKVKVRFVIDKEGHVQEPEVIESVHDGIFDEAALETIKKFVFSPAKKDGMSIDCIIQQTIVFAIRGGEPATFVAKPEYF